MATHRCARGRQLDGGNLLVDVWLDVETVTGRSRDDIRCSLLPRLGLGN
jgi:hypothetical protein